MITSKRIIWPDISKGIGILMIVFYHSIIPILRQQFGFSVFHQFLNTVEIPLFFFVSGWLFELNIEKYSRNKLKSIGKKFTHLMIPYFSFSVLYYILFNIALKISFVAPMINMGNGGYENFSIVDSIIQILTFENSMAKSLWFIYVLFIITAINILFPRFMKHPVTVIGLFLLPYTSMLFTFPDIIWRVIINLSYFSLARLVFGSTDKIQRINKYIYIFISILFVAGALGYSVGAYYELFSREGTVLYYLNIPIKALIAICGIIFICVGSAYIEKLNRTSKFLGYIGKNSFIIYLIHAPILTQAIVSFMIKFLPGVPPIFNCIFGTVVSVIISLLILKLILQKVPILNTIFTGAPYIKKRNKPVKNKLL